MRTGSGFHLVHNKETLLVAHIDKLKEEIGWLKVVFAILIATAISLGCLGDSKSRESQPTPHYRRRGSGPSNYSYHYLDE